MSVLLDTNILARAAQPEHPQNAEARDAVDILKKRGEQLCLVPQNFYEYWVVCTRPLDKNGLGLSAADTATKLAQLKKLFAFFPETPAVYEEWERLVARYEVKGKNAHDARLVAAMNVHGIPQLLTFNTGDFGRYDGLTVLSPPELLSPPAQQP